MTSEVKYLGDLRTEATHLASQQMIITDAPTDNQGRGEAFSPTDLVATALASCMITVMGIAARTHHIRMEGTTARILKIMAADPRRISGIDIEMTFPEGEYTDKEKAILEHTANNCPVIKSLHPDIKINTVFVWR